MGEMVNNPVCARTFLWDEPDWGKFFDPRVVRIKGACYATCLPLRGYVQSPALATHHPRSAGEQDTTAPARTQYH